MYFGLHMITGSRSLIYHYWPLCVLWATYDYRKQVIDLPLLTSLSILGSIWLQEADYWSTTTDPSVYFRLHMITGSRSLIYHYWPLCVLWATYQGWGEVQAMVLRYRYKYLGVGQVQVQVHYFSKVPRYRYRYSWKVPRYRHRYFVWWCH